MKREQGDKKTRDLWGLKLCSFVIDAISRIFVLAYDTKYLACINVVQQFPKVLLLPKQQEQQQYCTYL